MALIEKLTNIADAIREKSGSEEKYTLDGMAHAIRAISTGGAELPEEAYLITGDCSRRFEKNNWKWYLDYFGARLRTENITSINYMFDNSTNLKKIPFEINCQEGKEMDLSYIFGRSGIEEVPKINNCKPTKIQNMFDDAGYLKTIPDDIGTWFNWSALTNTTSTTNYLGTSIFRYCYSLRKVPMSLLQNENKNKVTTYMYRYQFAYCYSLDEIVNLPVHYTEHEITSNMFYLTIDGARHLKRFTFQTNEDGSPIAVKWKSQAINAKAIGYCPNELDVMKNNSGITEATRIIDDATYQEYKNHPDGWTHLEKYSRYNRASAVETINSLPDASAYLATAGGTNTITFTRISGSATDAGAIGDMTEEEIAVAAAKGWTVAFG